MSRVMTRTTIANPLIVLSLLYAGACHPQEDADVERIDAAALRAFLQEYWRDPISGEVDETTRFSFADVDLDADGKSEVIVYVAGRWFCGSGGCRLLLLRTENGSFAEITRMTLARLPVVVLATSTNGWRDISMRLQGGGILPGYWVKLSFDGSTYPSNPSTGGSRLEEPIEGDTLPLAESGALLYQ